MSIWSSIRGFFVPAKPGDDPEPAVMPAEETAEMMAVRRTGELEGQEWSPSMICLVPGEYGLVRRGQLVLRYDNRIDTVTLEVGQRFPPGLAAGDRWRRFRSQV